MFKENGFEQKVFYLVKNGAKLVVQDNLFERKYCGKHFFQKGHFSSFRRGRILRSEEKWPFFQKCFPQHFLSEILIWTFQHFFKSLCVCGQHGTSMQLMKHFSIRVVVENYTLGINCQRMPFKFGFRQSKIYPCKISPCILCQKNHDYYCKFT